MEIFIFCAVTFGCNVFTSQLTFTCSKSTMETLEKVWHMFRVNNKNIRTTSLTSFWCVYCRLWTYFIPFCTYFTPSIVDLEQVNVSRGYSPKYCYIKTQTYNYLEQSTHRAFTFKVNNRNTRAMCEICSKMKIKKPERRYWHHFDAFFVNFEFISDDSVIGF